MTRPDPHALAAATAVADALTDPRQVRPVTNGGRARPQSLAGGAAGIALLHIERARSGHGDEKVAHTWLSLAASEPISTGYNATLFHGAPALGFALHTAAATSRYRRALAALDNKIITVTRGRLAAAYARIGRGDRLPMHEFDLVHGLTGLGVYHLNRHPDHPITHDVFTYLIRLTQPFPGADRLPDSDGLPPWWLPGGLNGKPDPQRYPHGHGNLGVAHGISAVIALLSLAILRGPPAAGSHDALAELCAWTDRWRQHTGTSVWWPGYLTINHARHRQDHPPRPRPSWCYGLAGTARAQQLAGLALSDADRQDTAETAMLTTLRNPDLHIQLPEIGLCHGKAGLLQAAYRVAADARTPHPAVELADLSTHLAAQLSDPISDPELMDGAAGAALALHTAGTGTAPASQWDAFLLLA